MNLQFAAFPCLASCLALCLAACSNADEPPSPPVSERERLEREIDSLSRRIDAAPDDVDSYSKRGDALFFRGRFEKAVADYDKMAALDPRFEKTHWRRGIARFYDGQFTKAAEQFENYHTFDDIDRENGIWRYFSQWKAHGQEKARQGLLKYEKDDRPPFPALYAFFQGKTTAKEVLAGIEDADLPKDQRQSRLFYAHLYIGLDRAIAGKKECARRHLREAVNNDWPQNAGYGPHFMWHVGRLEYERLTEEEAEPR